jgi:hypothetical protein
MLHQPSGPQSGARRADSRGPGRLAERALAHPGPGAGDDEAEERSGEAEAGEAEADGAEAAGGIAEGPHRNEDGGQPSVLQRGHEACARESVRANRFGPPNMLSGPQETLFLCT